MKTYYWSLVCSVLATTGALAVLPVEQRTMLSGNIRGLVAGYEQRGESVPVELQLFLEGLTNQLAPAQLKALQRLTTEKPAGLSAGLEFFSYRAAQAVYLQQTEDPTVILEWLKTANPLAAASAMAGAAMVPPSAAIRAALMEQFERLAGDPFAPANADYGLLCSCLAQGLAAYTSDQIIPELRQRMVRIKINPAMRMELFRAFLAVDPASAGTDQWLAELFMDERHPPRLTEMLALAANRPDFEQHLAQLKQRELEASLVAISSNAVAERVLFNRQMMAPPAKGL